MSEDRPAEATSPPRPDTGLTRDHFVAFAITWVSYATYYLGRKGFGVSRKAIEGELGPDSLIGVETAYLAAYALGQYASGWAGDRFGASRLVGIGMLCAAAACALFGVSTTHAALFAAFMAAGVFQSTGWPGNIKAMAEWTTPATRGRVMGIWSTCYQAGGLIATSLATLLLTTWGWRQAFFVPAVVIGGVGLLVLLRLRTGPGAGPKAGSGTADEEQRRRDARSKLLRSPLIYCYGVSYFNLKLIRYSILFWLPFYLSKALGYTDEAAGYMSTSFEIGGIVGTVLIGMYSDRRRDLPRAVIAAACCVGLAIALFLYGQLGGVSYVANFVLMALVGALLFGPDTLVSGAAAQDAGGPLAAAIAAGIVNGIGSFGAVLQETVTRGVSGAWGWDALFYVFLGLALLSAAFLVPAFRARPAEA